MLKHDELTKKAKMNALDAKLQAYHMRTQVINTVLLMRFACICSLCVWVCVCVCVFVFFVDVQAWAGGDETAVTPEERRKGYQRLHTALQDKPFNTCCFLVCELPVKHMWKLSFVSLP